MALCQYKLNYIITILKIICDLTALVASYIYYFWRPEIMFCFRLPWILCMYWKNVT